MRPHLTLFISGILVTLLAAGAFAAELGAQRSNAGGVTVVVTPQNLAAGVKTWDFKIVLDTHSQDLRDDLLKTALLLDGTGARQAPVAWEGAAPGGHHRKGVLKFKPVSPTPATIELQIRRVGEANPRSFRWQLK